MMTMTKMMMLAALAVGTLLAASPAAVHAQESIVDVAVGVPELSTLVEFVVYADLVDALSDPESTFTVFAPVNTAFDAALELFGFTCTTCGPENGGPNVSHAPTHPLAHPPTHSLTH